jgi:RecJ-like exonuclease
MKIKTALYLLLASFGLLGLAFAGTQKPEKTDIGEIEPEDIGEKILIEGKVEKSYSTGDSGFLTVSDGTGNISVVSFDARTHFSEDERIRFSGRVTLYQGELELVVDQFYVP